jgi:hypothetical protein
MYPEEVLLLHVELKMFVPALHDKRTTGYQHEQQLTSWRSTIRSFTICYMGQQAQSQPHLLKLIVATVLTHRLAAVPYMMAGCFMNWCFKLFP